MIVINGLDDQTIFLVWSKVSSRLFKISDLYSFYSDYFKDYIYPYLDNQPLYAIFISFLGSHAGMYALIILTALSIFLLFYSAFIFFKKHKFSFCYVSVFVFSSYMWVHLGIHNSLFQIWLLPLFLYSLNRFVLSGLFYDFSKFFILAVIIVGSICISNYLGFFIAFYILLYSLLKALFEKDLNYLKNFIFVGIISFLLSFMVLFHYFMGAYRPNFAKILPDAGLILDRPYEDFFHFSSRPWYFFIPPVKNPWLGDVAQKAVDRIASTQYFLADDYFPGEHSANYFGLAFLTTVTVLSIIMLRTATPEKKKQITFYWILNFLLYLFMLPPFFTISGIKIYTPGELMYHFFPMFRVTTRMAPLLLLNFLIIFATSVDYLSQQSEKYKRVFKVFIPILTLVTLAETFIPPKIVYYDEPPNVYAYLGEVAPQEKFAVYPYSQADEALFWVDAHKGYLLNVRGYISDDYSAEHLTKSLPTEEGIARLKELGGSYLVVYKNLTSPQELNFFRTHPALDLSVENSSHALFTIR